MSFGKLLFGVLLLSVGALLLAMSLGIVPPDTPAALVRFWPVLLVAFGLAFLASALKNPALGCLAALLILGGMIFGVVWTSRQHSRDEVSHGVATVDLSKRAIQSLTVRTHTFAGALVLEGAPPKSRSIIVDVRNVAAGRGPTHRLTMAGKTAVLEWPERRGAIGFAPPGANVKIQIPETLPVPRIESWARFSSTRVDLDGLRPRKCAFDQFASSLALDLGDGRPDSIRIKGFASTARLRIEPDCTVELVITSPFTMRSLPSDFIAHAPGRGKARIFTSKARGPTVHVRVDGPLLRFKIERAAGSAI